MTGINAPQLALELFFKQSFGIGGMERIMATNLDELLPSAQDVMKKIALKEAEKASEAMRKRAEAEAEQKAELERLSKPSGLSEEEKIKIAASVIQRAVTSGRTELQVYRFSNKLCTDHGRAINQMEPGWEQTLTGIPKEVYQLWYDYLRPRGYKIKFQVVDWSGGVPGDIGVTLKWG